MPTVEDLGKAVKAKYSGAYDDLPDADLGRKIQAKFPGAYDDYGEVQSATKPAVNVSRATMGQPAGLPHPDDVDQQTTNNARFLAAKMMAPPAAAPALPFELRPDSETGNPFGQGGFGTGLEAAANLDPSGVFPGALHAGQGVKQVATGDNMRERATGARKVLSGAMEAGTGAMAGGAVKAPLKTALVLGTGVASQAGIEAGLKKLGMPEEYAGLVGDLGGIIAGVGTHEAISPRAVTAIKAKYEPILKARAEKAARPEPTANSTGTEPYKPKETPNEEALKVNATTPGRTDVVAQPGGGSEAKSTPAGKAGSEVKTPEVLSPAQRYFETAKGSKYETVGKGTRRHKIVTGERFEPSDQTVYVKPDVSHRVMQELQTNNFGSLKASVRTVGDGQIGIVVKDRATSKIRNDLSRTIPVSDAPEVGLHPLELWHKNPETGEHGFHLGHAITKIGDARLEPADSVPDAEAEPGKPTATVAGAGLGALQPYYDKMVASLKESADEVRALKAKRDAALEAMKRSEITPEEKQHGARIREYMTGERDLWGARVNQTVAKLKKLLPGHVDQEALSLMRDFKNRPGELGQFAIGTHPDLAKLAPDDYKTAMEALDKIRPSIDRALNPTPKMQVADAVLTQIADLSLSEGKKVGFLDSSLTSDEYTPHLLHPKGEGEFAGTGGLSERGSAMGGKIDRKFAFAKERTIPTLAHAVAYGLRPKTLNAFDAFTIHGDKFATARATNLLVKELKGQGVGKWGARAGDGNVPAGWVEIAPHAHPFQNVRAFTDTEGNPQIARQTLFVPKFIEEAMRPITDPNYMNRVAGFRNVRAFQAVAKAGELGLSLFHLKAENYMALANMGPKGWAKAQLMDRASPEFLSAERDMVLHGGTSSIQGKTFEAYKSLQPGSIPTRFDMVRKWPGIKQLDQMAGGVTNLIFDNQVRRFKVTNYALRKASWMAEHPNATPAENTAAMHSIAQEINAVYGGLHWENLGVNRATQEMSRFLMLAPDWTFSNFYNVKTMTEGGWKGSEGGKMARAFWLRAIVGGIAVTQLYSLLMTQDPATLMAKIREQPFRALTNSYLGQDSEGRDVWQNVGFAGATSDVVNLVNNVSRFGLLEGPLKSVMGKAAPGLRAAMEVAFNEDFLGHKITSPEFSIAGNTARGAWFLVKSLAPIPFTFTNVIDMATNGNEEQQATAKEIFGTLLFGQAARHLAPEGERWSAKHGLRPKPEPKERSFAEEFSQTIR